MEDTVACLADTNRISGGQPGVNPSGSPSEVELSTQLIGRSASRDSAAYFGVYDGADFYQYYELVEEVNSLVVA